MHTNLPGSWGATVTHMMGKMWQWAVRWCLSFCNLNVRIFYCLCVQLSSVSQTVVRDHPVSESQNEWMETTLKYIKQTCISIAWVKNLSAVMKKSVCTYKVWMYAFMLLMKVPWKLISTGMGSSREQHHVHLGHPIKFLKMGEQSFVYYRRVRIFRSMSLHIPTLHFNYAIKIWKYKSGRCTDVLEGQLAKLIT
jgi:hypothetical protein